jgi:ribose transport system permease protein
MSATSGTEAPPAGPSKPGMQRARSVGRDSLERYGLLFIAIAVALFFSFLPSTSDTFPTTANLQTILANQSVAAIVALAALIPLVLKEFDLSVGATLGLSSVFSASAMSWGWPPVLALLLGVALGAAVGLANGLLVTRFKINAVIATLGMATAIHGVVLWRTGGEPIVEGIPLSWTDFGGGSLLGVPNTAWVLLAIVVCVYFVLEHTSIGRHMYMLGSNPDAARLVGIRTRLMTLMAFVAAGVMAGMAGILQLARSGSASSEVGERFTLTALAAAFLSAAAIRPGRFNAGGVIVAVAFLATLNGGLNLAGAATYVADLVNGVALIVGVGIAGFLSRRRGHDPNVSFGANM